MQERTIHNPVTGETFTFLETATETAGERSVGEMDCAPGGGVPVHRHADHEEFIEVLEGEIEVTMNGNPRRLQAGERVVIGRGVVHTWRNPSSTQRLKFRGGMTPGHPGFERFLRVFFGLGRDGQLKSSGMPRHFSDLALLAYWDPSIVAGSLRLLAPFMRWSARRSRSRGRDVELLQRYGA